MSAARKNRENAWTDDYAKLCAHYGMQPTRNNPGQSHENGVVECANGSLKQRLSQQLKLRGHADFDSVGAYQSLIDKVVDKLNRRTRSRFDEEQLSLQPLPGDEMADYRTFNVKVTRSSTIEVKRVVYTVPSRLIGERIQVRVHHDQLALYVGQQLALTLPRVYPKPGEQRGVASITNTLFAHWPPNHRRSATHNCVTICCPTTITVNSGSWLINTFEPREACKWIVTVLRLAFEYDDEECLGLDLLAEARAGRFASIKDIQSRYLRGQEFTSATTTTQHSLISYNELLSSIKSEGQREDTMVEDLFMSDTVALLLKELKLPAFVRHYQSLWDRAIEQGWSHTDYLAALCEYELSDRYQRRTYKWLREAGLATHKTFATLENNALIKAQQTTLAKLQQDTDWAHRADNVLLIGPSGTGKTHIANALGHQLVEQGVRCKLFPAIALVQLLQQAKRDLDLMTAMTRLDKYRVLIIDDIGYVKNGCGDSRLVRVHRPPLRKRQPHRYGQSAVQRMGSNLP